MHYKISTSGGATELIIKERLTFAEAATFPAVLAELEKSRTSHLDIRLAELTFIDSTGMSLFVHIYDSANSKGTKVVIHGATGPVRQALSRAAFETLFEFR